MRTTTHNVRRLICFQLLISTSFFF